MKSGLSSIIYPQICKFLNDVTSWNDETPIKFEKDSWSPTWVDRDLFSINGKKYIYFLGI